MLRYFYGSFAFTAVCIGLGAYYGYVSGGGIGGLLATVWILVVLGALEVSLSFDNAVVNASVLKTMDPKWQQRFLTWGILIAVFGMRIVFPVLIVVIATGLGPIESVRLALSDPEQYEHIIEDAHTGIMGFGGAFLLLVGFRFFFDRDKDVHWIEVIERPLVRFASLHAFEIIVTLLLIYFLSTLMPVEEGRTFLVSAIFGISTFFAVQWVGALLEAPEVADGTAKAGLGAFLYLELLDASFSFDGVIGAFALSNNMIIIALGLGIGAIFVRSMTVALVRKGTLAQFVYLEHGAFWAIVALAAIMLASPVFHIPEVITGLIGITLIGLAVWSSIRAKPLEGEPVAAPAAAPAPAHHG